MLTDRSGRRVHFAGDSGYGHWFTEIGRRYPSHAVIGEETGTSGTSEWQWVLDPLDGTRNFVHGIPVFGVSAAVLHRGRPVAAAISLPALGGTYSAAGPEHQGE